jgi:hypothetical protein
MTEMVEALGAARRALTEAADLLERAAERASLEWPVGASVIEEYVTAVDELVRELELDLLTDAVLVALREADESA